MIQCSFSKFRRGRLLMMPVFATLVFLLSGCLDNDDRPVEPIPLGYVSIYHAAPDAPALDIKVDNRRVNSGPFDYSEYSGYMNFYTGDRNIKFSAVNAANDLIDTTFSVTEGKAYSLFVINGASGLETLVVADSAATPASGKAMVRFVQLSPDGTAMNVGVKGESSPLFTNATFRQATAFKEVEAKTYSFDVTSAADGSALLSANDVVIRPGGYYTIVTRGFTTPPAGNTNVLSVEVL